MTSNSRYCPARTAGRFGHIERSNRGLLRSRGTLRSVAVRAIDNAEREILVGAYGLTTGSAGTFPQAAQALRIACHTLSKCGPSGCSRPPASTA